MVKCSNCHCDIEESKMMLHERFCIQNIKYCNICQEAIIKEEYDEHCENHNKNKSEIIKLDSQEKRNSRSLQRIRSSKVACEYCGLFLGYSELEEHEEMCGSRTTKCNICGQNFLYKTLGGHLISIHGINKEDYKQYDSGLLNNNSFNINKTSNQQNQPKNLSEFELNRMSSDERIAYALALSEQNNGSNNGNNTNSNSVSNNNKNQLPRKSNSSFNYDEIDNEYERQMYEDEMKNYGCDE